MCVPLTEIVFGPPAPSPFPSRNLLVRPVTSPERESASDIVSGGQGRLHYMDVTLTAIAQKYASALACVGVRLTVWIQFLEHLILNEKHRI
jgi:hypothetical protein